MVNFAIVGRIIVTDRGNGVWRLMGISGANYTMFDEDLPVPRAQELLDSIKSC